MAFFTALTDGELGRAEAVNSRLREMQAAIEQRQGVTVEIAPWTTLAANAPSIDIPVLPGFRALTLMAGLRSNYTGGLDAVRISFNGEITSDYRVMTFVNPGNTSSADNAANGWLFSPSVATSDALAGTYGYLNMKIDNASAPLPKMVQFDTALFYLTNDSVRSAWGSAWNPITATIISLRVVPALGSAFLAGSHWALYGMT